MHLRKPTQNRSALYRALRTGYVVTFLVCCSSCRESPTTVSGDVTLDGKALSVRPEARGKVVFQPEGGRGTVSIGELDSAGHFQLSTGSSVEVAPGKYQVAISVVEALPKKENAEQSARLITPARYGSATDSGFHADVKNGEKNVFSFALVSETDEEETSSTGTSPASAATAPPSHDSK
jgi:hypothetical protein